MLLLQLPSAGECEAQEEEGALQEAADAIQLQTRVETTAYARLRGRGRTSAQSFRSFMCFNWHEKKASNTC